MKCNENYAVCKAYGPCNGKNTLTIACQRWAPGSPPKPLVGTTTMY